MSWRIEDCVIRGELDCRTRGLVTGTIWLRGHGEPLRLSLSGNPLGDLAGCVLTFTNPKPQPSRISNLAALTSDQTGRVGDMTASLRVDIFDAPLEKILELGRAEKPVPTRQANALHIEWFSNRNGRVVIETTDYQIALSVPPLWRMTVEEDDEQYESNADAFRDYLDDMDRSTTGPDDSDEPSDETEIYDEFKWEKMLKESDERGDRYGAALEKYDGHPDSERLVAREMKWHWVEDELDAEERGLYDEEDDIADEMDDEAEELDLDEIRPNPLTEGRDWVRDSDGDIQHPLCVRTSRLAVRMWRLADEFNVLSDEKDSCVHDMVFNTQCCGAKLAGALNDIAYEFGPDPGMIVASLKRALNHLHQALNASDTVKKSHKLDASGQLDNWRNELFAIREEILRLMEEHRRNIS